MFVFSKYYLSMQPAAPAKGSLYHAVCPFVVQRQRVVSSLLLAPLRGRCTPTFRTSAPYSPSSLTIHPPSPPTRHCTSLLRTRCAAPTPPLCRASSFPPSDSCCAAPPVRFILLNYRRIYGPLAISSVHTHPPSTLKTRCLVCSSCCTSWVSPPSTYQFRIVSLSVSLSPQLSSVLGPINDHHAFASHHT